MIRKVSVNFSLKLKNKDLDFFLVVVEMYLDCLLVQCHTVSHSIVVIERIFLNNYDDDNNDDNDNDHGNFLTNCFYCFFFSFEHPHNYYFQCLYMIKSN